MKIKLTLFCLLAWLACPACYAQAKPNYLFIAVDDLNDWIGALGGHPQAKTPNIDRLAKRGVLFANAHTQAPLCNPSRASLLSGLRPSTTGLYTLQPGVRAVPALKNHVMLPQYLAQHGYATFSTGKIYHDGSLKPEERNNEIQEWGTNGTPPYPPQKFVNSPDPIKAMDWGVFPERDEDQGDWKIADAAIQYLKKAKVDKPFFLGVGFRYPHVPCFASQKWWDLYPDDKLIMPPVKMDDRADVPEFAWYLHWKLPEPRLSWLQANNQWRPLVRAYLATISFMDSQVGRVLAAQYRTLEEMKRLAATLNTIGEQIKRGGLQLAYHNFGWDFMEQGGVIPYDIILKETDPALVKMELDLYWFSFGSRTKPLDWFKKQPGRFVIWHIKDMNKQNRDLHEVVGDGQIDFKPIFKDTQLSGVKHMFVEQGNNYVPDAMSCVQRSADYMKKSLLNNL